MSDRFTIWMSYSQAMRQAELLAQQADHMKRLGSERISALLHESSVGWRGENADAYRTKMSLFRNELSQTANQLTNMADIIRQIARNTYQADMRALELAEKRKY